MTGTDWIPERAFVEVHMGCPHRCKQCYQVAAGMERDRHLSLADALERIRRLKGLGIKEVVPVTGEVLEHPEYLECYREAGWTEYLVSNGRLLPGRPELGEKIVEIGFKAIRISAHYHGLQEDGRQRPTSPYSLLNVPRIVAAAARHGLKTQAFCLVGNFNFSQISSAHSRAEADGLSELRLINLMPTSRELKPHCLNGRQLAEVFRQVELVRKLKPDSMTKLRFLGNFGPRPGSKNGERLARQKRYCPAGREGCYIKVDGSVHGCHFMLSPDQAIGRMENGKLVRTSDLAELDRTTCPLSSTAKR